MISFWYILVIFLFFSFYLIIRKNKYIKYYKTHLGEKGETPIYIQAHLTKIKI